ncbi:MULTISPECIES: MAE_28990/MAE_18760 family HEPN-like nuclease [Giesbergeria]|uniref:MAE_28990/MAE_18760 family HEPN-like nuclease n=1 Tax=Giesbergeria sinuosa TaxID=80883 RepID=A0ABV9QCI0_9BURK
MNCVPITDALLQDRKAEVDDYLKFLEVALERNSIISANGGATSLSLSINITHTLKANLLLLLYSAMEATLIQLLDEMHDAINSNCDSADNLNSELLRLVLKTFQKNANTQSFSANSPLHQELFKHWMNDWQGKTTAKEKRSDGISGSVDGVVFYKQLKKFGVIAATPNDKPPPHLTHWALQKIKNDRNDLAHGEKSFVDLGRMLSLEELKINAEAVFVTLKNIALEVDSYLSSKCYLAIPSTIGSAQITGALPSIGNET